MRGAANATVNRRGASDPRWETLCERLLQHTRELAPDAAIGPCRPQLLAALVDFRLTPRICEMLDGFVTREGETLRATFARLVTDSRVRHTIPREALVVLLAVGTSPEIVSSAWPADEIPRAELDAIASAFASPYR